MVVRQRGGPSKQFALERPMEQCPHRSISIPQITPLVGTNLNSCREGFGVFKKFPTAFQLSSKSRGTPCSPSPRCKNFLSSVSYSAFVNVSWVVLGRCYCIASGMQTTRVDCLISVASFLQLLKAKGSLDKTKEFSITLTIHVEMNTSLDSPVINILAPKQLAGNSVFMGGAEMANG